jgi:hypothetical protein
MPAPSSIERKSLTPAERLELTRFQARWSAIRRSTAPADRDAAEEGVRLAYGAAGLAPPARIVWCDSPIQLAERAGHLTRADGANVRPALIDRLRRRVFAGLRQRLPRKLRKEIEAAVSPSDALVAASAEMVAQAIGNRDAALLTRYRRGEPLSWSSVLQALLGRVGFRYDAAGAGDLAWLSTCDYLRHVLGLVKETEPLVGLVLLAANAGWVQPHANTCFISERPELMHGDANDRLHDSQGPALRLRDGWSAYVWRGVQVPSWMIERPDSITPSAIDRQDNVQVRRCMIEIMTPERYVASGAALRVAEDATGILWRRIWLPADASAVVEVINATPEPDGTRKHFFLQVPPHLRTAREAVAWTYGLRPDVYDKLVVRT